MTLEQITPKRLTEQDVADFADAWIAAGVGRSITVEYDRLCQVTTVIAKEGVDRTSCIYAGKFLVNAKNPAEIQMKALTMAIVALHGQKSSQQGKILECAAGI